MKRSDMVIRIYNYFHLLGLEIDEETTDDLLKHMERCGMQPPVYFEKYKPGWPAIRKNEWEPETPPSIIEETINQALIDKALEHIERNGLCGKMVITK